MKCVFCDRDLIRSSQTIERRIKNHLVYIKDVPVELCKNCGEVYVDDSIVSQMNILLEHLSRKEILETIVVDFNTFSEISATSNSNLAQMRPHNYVLTT